MPKCRTCDSMPVFNYLSLMPHIPNYKMMKIFEKALEQGSPRLGTPALEVIQNILMASDGTSCYILQLTVQGTFPMSPNICGGISSNTLYVISCF